MTKKLITISTALLLATLHFIARDDLATKLESPISNALQYLHIITVPIIGYFISKQVSKYSTSKFLFIFLLLSSFSIYHFLSAAISNRILKKELRISLNSKIIKLDYAGWGYEADSLNFDEYLELDLQYFPKIPDLSKNIFIYNWQEFDERRVLEFNVSNKLSLKEFYGQDAENAERITKIEFDEIAIRHRLVYGKIKKETTHQLFDTIGQNRYKWESSVN